MQDLPQIIRGTNKSFLKIRFQEHSRCIKNNIPRSSYALHLLNCRHEYGNINDTMTLLRQVIKPSLFPYEQMFIQSLHHSNELINGKKPTNIIPCLNSSSQKHLTSQTIKTPYQQPSPTISSHSSCVPTGHQELS